jgi:hypothetical protein
MPDAFARSKTSAGRREFALPELADHVLHRVAAEHRDVDLGELVS